MHLAITVVRSVDWLKQKELMWKWEDIGSVLLINTVSDGIA